MWWYNILGGEKGSISHIVQLDTITSGSILLTANLVALKRENYEPILILKITELRKFIYYFGLSTESDPYRVVKQDIHFVCIWSITITSYGNHHIAR